MKDVASDRPRLCLGQRRLMEGLGRTSGTEHVIRPISCVEIGDFPFPHREALAVFFFTTNAVLCSTRNIITESLCTWDRGQRKTSFPQYIQGELQVFSERKHIRHFYRCIALYLSRSSIRFRVDLCAGLQL